MICWNVFMGGSLRSRAFGCLAGATESLLCA